MHNPNSFKKLKYGYKLQVDNTILVEFIYQGTNKLGGIVKDTAYFKVNPNTCTLIE